MIDDTLTTTRAPGPADPADPSGDPGGAAPAVARYRLKGRLGGGGMGEVWVADQEEPVRRRVAIKLIRAGKVGAQVAGRFESERQALALMNHPNIAQVFDAGTAADGRPFFAMELVQGEPITQYCDRHHLPVSERLALFLQVCDGVQHAHQKGVIHRDIKPSNVLVADDGGASVCKIIDFGVAKAIEGPLTETWLRTHAGFAVGTPAYMSPEQAGLSGLDVDTRTDVYSLGVLLYELLVGVLPFEAEDAGARRRAKSAAETESAVAAGGAAPDDAAARSGRDGTRELLRRLRDDEAPRPSRRLATFDSARAGGLAASRGTEAGLLRRRLAGDLDWIVMKAIEKDRARRYASPGELAGDVGRSLRDQPVVAGPPTVGYRMRKFVRRHRLAVAGSALVGAAIVAGFGLALWGFVHARRSEADARREAATAEQTAAFLVDLFQVSNPDRAHGRAVTARELLDRGAAQIRSELKNQPLVQARMMLTIGEVYEGLAQYDEALPLIEEGLETRRRLLGPEHPDTLDAMARLARLRSETGDIAGVEETLRGILAVCRRQDGDDGTSTLRVASQLGGFLHARGRMDEAEALYQDVLARRRRLPDVDPRDLYLAMGNLASLLQDRGRGDQAEALYRESLTGLRTMFGPDDTMALRAENNLATLLVGQGKLADSERTFRDLLDANRRIYGPDHPETLTTTNNLGVVLSMEGRLAEAEPYYRDALDRRRRLLGDDHPDTMYSIHNMGGLLVDQGKFAEGERYRREAWERRTRVLGPDHPDTLEAANNLGEVLYRLDRVAEAETHFRRAADGRRRVLGPEHLDTLLSLGGLAKALQKQGRIDDAIVLRREVLATLKKTQPDDGLQIGAAMSRLGDCLGEKGAGDEAESMLVGGYETLARAVSADPASAPPTVRHDALERLVRYYERAGRTEQAASWRARMEAPAPGK